eukprot:CAMPEP_0119121696 /NCGR_PEP_ID=MMETSP1310-20130426/2206_1 /TAXON_ID=464262 /ORGANISM="Genus nov. species nov., Strain RCC2339" /LENGTH=205 /DNA_ID=CAMNT_0007111273 /DNA_START=86 /DNA_END=703 /DNA_ORIENTATION=+
MESIGHEKGSDGKRGDSKDVGGNVSLEVLLGMLEAREKRITRMEQTILQQNEVIRKLETTVVELAGVVHRRIDDGEVLPSPDSHSTSHSTFLSAPHAGSLPPSDLSSPPVCSPEEDSGNSDGAAPRRSVEDRLRSISRAREEYRAATRQSAADIRSTIAHEKLDGMDWEEASFQNERFNLSPLRDTISNLLPNGNPEDQYLRLDM